MNANGLRNAMLALNLIDFIDFREAIISDRAQWSDGSVFIEWALFRDNPVQFYTRTTDTQREALFALIQKHLDEESEHD